MARTLQVVDLAAWAPAPPVALMVHGGCWQTNIADRTLMNWIAGDLRRASRCGTSIIAASTGRRRLSAPSSPPRPRRPSRACRAYHLDLSRRATGSFRRGPCPVAGGAAARSRAIAACASHCSAGHQRAIERRMVAPLKPRSARLGDANRHGTNGEATLDILYRNSSRREAAYTLARRWRPRSSDDPTPSDDLPPSDPVPAKSTGDRGVVSLGSLRSREAARPQRRAATRSSGI